MDQQDKKQAKAFKANCKDAAKANNEGQQEGGEQEAIVEATITVEETTAMPAELLEFAAALREFGGVQPLMDAVRSLKANSDSQKAAVVARLAANARCAFSQAELTAMTLEQLSKLEASIAPRNYIGQNGAMAVNAGDDLRVFKGVETKEKAANA